jgi:hypothetical protein
MEENCQTCNNLDEFGFCTKLVIDTKRCFVENNKSIKAYYLDVREEDDCRTAFIVPNNFKCIYFKNKP